MGVIHPRLSQCSDLVADRREAALEDAADVLRLSPFEARASRGRLRVTGNFGAGPAGSPPQRRGAVAVGFRQGYAAFAAAIDLQVGQAGRAVPGLRTGRDESCNANMVDLMTRFRRAFFKLGVGIQTSV